MNRPSAVTAKPALPALTCFYSQHVAGAGDVGPDGESDGNLIEAGAGNGAEVAYGGAGDDERNDGSSIFSAANERAWRLAA